MADRRSLHGVLVRSLSVSHSLVYVCPKGKHSRFVSFLIRWHPSFHLDRVYNILRHHVSKGYEWYNFPLFVTNKALAWLVLRGMASCQIPGKYIEGREDSSVLSATTYAHENLH